jgi:lysine-ketoglutarate reductase/saccharopine dehydrogenase-like protein (TIGR00300 family)
MVPTVGARETVEVTGHLMDSGILSRVLDDIREYRGDYVINTIDVGHESEDPSSARITVEADDDDALQRILMRLQTRGVNMLEPGDAVIGTTDRPGVLPDGFYATTDLATRVRIGGTWHDVENPEMDCGLVVADSPQGVVRVRTVPLSDVTTGMRVVVGASGVQVVAPGTGVQAAVFARTDSGGLADSPPAAIVRQVADGMRAAKSDGKRLLWVVGPGVVHTGAGPALVSLIRGGFVDILFAGNALAIDDIESSLYGTGPGRDLSMVQGVPHGREHRVRALNTVRRAGSTAAAVASGVLTSGIMHALVTQQKRFVLVGSVRDESPLPDVHTDVVEGRRAMRAEIHDVGYCLMMATQLHSAATVNLLPDAVPLVCVDTNPAMVNRIVDRGSDRGRGVVTDVGLFLAQLARELVPG